MKAELIMTIIRWAIPFVFTALFTLMGNSLKNIRGDNRAMKAGLLAIIRSQIVSKCEEYQKRGYLPEYARYCLEDLHKQYKALGGNHGIEVLVDNTFELPSTLDVHKKEK